MQSIQGTKTLVKTCGWANKNVQPVRFSVKSTSVSPAIITLPVLAGVRGQLVLSFRVTADTTFKTEIKAQGLETIQGLSVGDSYLIQPNLLGEIVFQSNGPVWEVQSFQASLTAPLVIEGNINQIGTSAPIVHVYTPLPAGFVITPIYNDVGDYTLELPAGTWGGPNAYRHMFIQPTSNYNVMVQGLPNPINNENLLHFQTFSLDTDLYQNGLLTYAPFRLTIWPVI